jgi:cysteinyl-tRNA synthetase, unknown class
MPGAGATNMRRTGWMSGNAPSGRLAMCRCTTRAVAALTLIALMSSAVMAAGQIEPKAPAIAANPSIVPPAPKPAVRTKTLTPTPPKISSAEATATRLKRINAAKSWGYQLASLSIDKAAKSPYDMLVVDATTGLDTGKPFTKAEVERLKVGPDGRRRLVISYLSVGEAEDYRGDYFSPEYLEEEAPDWLMKENPQWKGNRIIRFCHEGWQRTILGDDDGRNLYRGDEPSPLYKLLELGFDGVYLDRVDVYAEIKSECPDGANKMVDFVARLAAHARKQDPTFMVILQNAEELLEHPKMVNAIDAVAKESLFYGQDMSQNKNEAKTIQENTRLLKLAKKAGRAVFVVDYVTDSGRKADAIRRIEGEQFVPYIGPRDLAKLWLPGVEF